jgi:hypothetical protein
VNLSASLSLNNQGLIRGLSDARASLAAFRGALAGIVAPAASIAAAITGVVGGIGVLRKSLGQAAEMENFESSFTTLLGSLDAAKARMQDLARFAAATPFELPQVTQASRLLQAFTGNALSTSRGLRLVGDSAAAVGQPLEAVSIWFGRLYSALSQGAPLGEPIQNLTQLGLISNTARKQLMGLQGTALDGGRAMRVLEQAFGANAGAMERMSRTYDGKLSTMRDAINSVFRAFGEPIRDALKPVIDRMTLLIENFAVSGAKRLGAMAGEAIATFAGAWKSGQLGELLGQALSVGVQKSVNLLLSGMVAGGTAFATMIGAALENLDAIGDVLVGAAAKFGAALLTAVQKPLAYIQATMEEAFDSDNRRLKNQAEERARDETLKKFGVKSEAELRGGRAFNPSATSSSWMVDAVGNTNRELPPDYLAERERRRQEIAAQLGVKTIESRAQSIMASGGPRFGFGGEAMTSGDIQAAATARMQEGMAKLKQPMAATLKEIGTQLMNFKVTDFMGVAEAEKRLAAFAEQLRALAGGGAKSDASKAANGAIDAAAEAMQGGGGGGASAPERFGKPIDLGDRISRIGGFIGRGGPALDYAKATAANTAAMVKILTRRPAVAWA